HNADSTKKDEDITGDADIDAGVDFDRNADGTIRVRRGDAINDGNINDSDADNEKPLTPKEAEVAARESTLNTLDDYFDFVDDLERKDWFVQYLNTIVEVFDPHTFYFAPE